MEYSKEDFPNQAYTPEGYKVKPVELTKKGWLAHPVHEWEGDDENMHEAVNDRVTDLHPVLYKKPPTSALAAEVKALEKKRHQLEQEERELRNDLRQMEREYEKRNDLAKWCIDLSLFKEAESLWFIPEGKTIPVSFPKQNKRAKIHFYRSIDRYGTDVKEQSTLELIDDTGYGKNYKIDPEHVYELREAAMKTARRLIPQKVDELLSQDNINISIIERRLEEFWGKDGEYEEELRCGRTQAAYERLKSAWKRKKLQQLRAEKDKAKEHTKNLQKQMDELL